MRSRLRSLLAMCAFSLHLAALTNACSAELKVAVAANFSAPMKQIAHAFKLETGHSIATVPGSTGLLYAQIRNGAGFAVLLSADQHTPLKLEQEGMGWVDTRFTYAIGRLALWSREPGRIDSGEQILKAGGSDRIALANPRLAPYGAAAVQVMNSLGVLGTLQARLVEGSSIGQAYQFVASGNAPIGFVALSQIYINGRIVEGSAWIVPDGLYEPIRQDAILLKAGGHLPSAHAFMDFLRGDRARSIMRAYGYRH
jgi:molybdate transport system substrate-binding protein